MPATPARGREVGHGRISLAAGRFLDPSFNCDCATALAGDLLRGITPARHDRTVTPNEDDSDPAAQCSEGRRRKILDGGVTTRREVLKIFKYPRV